jgi:hypothetical protein
VSYLELAQQATRDAPKAERLCLQNASLGCEKSERSEKSSQAGQDDDDRVTCRIIERDLGLTSRSLTLWEPIR